MGKKEGLAVGIIEGVAVGTTEGRAVGITEGVAVGTTEGLLVGIGVGMVMRCHDNSLLTWPKKSVKKINESQVRHGPIINKIISRR